MEWYSAGIEDVVNKLDTDIKNGLGKQSADTRLERCGRNRLKGNKRKSMAKKIAEQLADFMIVLLLGAAVISFVISIFEGEANFTDTVLILAIIILNAIMGIVQESKAEHAIEALQKLSAPKTTVIRGGRKQETDSELIVPGDIVIFEAGDSITADARILEASGLRTEESSLTGESVPIDKRAQSAVPPGTPIAERKNMLYSGSSVVAGRCRVVVVATGMDTEVGKIARLISVSEPPETPLQKRLAGIGKVLGIAAIAICALIFILGLIQRVSILESFMLSVSLAVAAVPEGLPAVVTIVLALGVQRLAKNNAIIRKLPAVETLGSATVICSDKTGTLTQNKMTVTEIHGAAESGKAPAQKILQYAALCTNTSGEGDGLIGEPTENAIVEAARIHGISKTSDENRFPRVAELPFDSSRKLMTTIHRRPEGGYMVITKGAPDVLLPLCKAADLERAEPMTGRIRDSILRRNTLMAQKALRVLAVAYRKTETVPRGGEAERELVFLGLIGMIDPPRPGVRDAVLTCKRAGIKPVMITGDHVVTACAIARELGIMSGSSKALTGPELDTMGDSELRRSISKYSVFARVSPEHKSRIVTAYQDNGEIVAMTGDGVNDAPALKCADIGCAMGRSGTDVARDASDMILADDNFGTIVQAVKEGRGIYQNIRKTVHFLLSSNIGEILIILVSFILGRTSPLIPIQLLWINLVTDSLPALALGAERAEPDIMDKKPLSPKSSMFSEGKGLDIIVQGIMIGALALIAQDIGTRMGGQKTGQTFAFAVLGLSQLVHAFNVRSDLSLFKIGFFSNGYMAGAFIVCAIMQVSVICVPALSSVFGTVPLTVAQWQIVALLALAPLAAVEASKLIFGERHKAYGKFQTY